VIGIAFNIASAVSALVAAIFWYLSAVGELPPMISYFGYAPPDDPFLLAMQTGVILNRWAAGFAALSALCAGLGTISSLIGR